MAILIRTIGKKWQPAQQLDFKEEAHLQSLLYDSPDLLTTQEEEIPAVLMREAGLPGSGYTDLIGVDATGNILIVETKLAKNQEIRRKVIGQVLEYAAFLWQMSFEQFDALFKAREGKTISELFSERSDAVLAEELTDKVSENLANGRFKLLIAVDDINPELEKVIAYLSSFRNGPSLEALEVKVYQQGETQVFVPQRHGTISPEPATRTGHVTIAEILDNTPDEHSRNLYQLLVNEWEKLGHTVHPASAGASFKANINGSSQPIFWAFPRFVQALMKPCEKRGAPDRILSAYRSALSALPGFDPKRIISDDRPTTDFSKITEAEVRTFVIESDKLVRGWRDATANKH